MENKGQGFGFSSSSSSNPSSYSSTSSTLDHIFGSKDSSISSSSGGAFASIFPPPSTVLGRNASRPEALLGSSTFMDDTGNFKYGNPGNSTEVKGATNKGRSNKYQNEIGEPCYLSSSIHYGGQENYSPRINGNADSHHVFKKDDNESYGNNSESASRGNWWQGSLYY